MIATFNSLQSLMTYVKKSFALSVIFTMLAIVAYASYEPAFVDAQSANDTVIVTLNVTAGIAISSPDDVSMSASLGIAQNSAIGTTTWNVKTNAAGGYTLAVNATGSPAMVQSGGTPFINDFRTGTPGTWTATSGAAYFGYSGYGTDIPTGTWGTGSTCSGATAHATSTTLKYTGFTTSPVTIASRSSTTTPSGVDSTVCFAVEQAGVYVPSGTYRATIVATATAL